MGIPAADIGEGSFDAEVGFEELSDLLHVVAELGVWILDAGRGLVLGGVGVAQHLDRVECFFAGGVEEVIAGFAVHCGEGGSSG